MFCLYGVVCSVFMVCMSRSKTDQSTYWLVCQPVNFPCKHGCLPLLCLFLYSVLQGHFNLSDLVIFFDELYVLGLVLL